ncbi:MAG: PQQ-dependent sugar dehydrogenase [Pyrinomonadaceae bacterium]
MKRKLVFAFSRCGGLMFILAAFVSAQIKLAPHKINLKNGKSFSLNLPENFDIIPAVEGLKRVRFFAKSPDGRIFATDMRDLSDNKKGAVYILDGWNADTGKFEKVTPYLTNLRNPNSVAFFTDANGQDWFYLAETDKLTRRKFTKGETKSSDNNPQTLATFPDYGLSYKYGGWHLTRTVTFSPAGKLYLSVGSSCNACREKEEVRASILEMNADGSGQRFYAKGLRNAVWIEWIGKFLFATNQGVDHLGLNKPDETFYAIKDGTDYGWASCYQSDGKVFSDPKYPGKNCQNVPASYAFFPAHSSALGFAYFDEADSDAAIKDSFVVALHGSTNKRIGHGYKIVTTRKGEPNQDLITGFLNAGTVFGRPCGIIKLDGNSFLFTDDYSGVIYYVRKKGMVTRIADDESKPVETNQPNAGQNNSNLEQAGSTPPDSAPKSKTCFGLAAIICGICLSAFFSR